MEDREYTKSNTPITLPEDISVGSMSYKYTVLFDIVAFIIFLVMIYDILGLAGKKYALMNYAEEINTITDIIGGISFCMMFYAFYKFDKLIKTEQRIGLFGYLIVLQALYVLFYTIGSISDSEFCINIGGLCALAVLSICFVAGRRIKKLWQRHIGTGFLIYAIGTFASYLFIALLVEDTNTKIIEFLNCIPLAFMTVLLDGRFSYERFLKGLIFPERNIDF